MTELQVKTDAGLWQRLSDSAKRDFGEGEAEEQRVSFIYSGLSKKSALTKAEIKKTLKCG